MTLPREALVQALMMLIKYMVSTEKRGLLLLPKEKWSTDHKFKVYGQSDSDYMTNPEDCRSISCVRV